MSNLITSRPKGRFLKRIRPVQKKTLRRNKKTPRRFTSNAEAFSSKHRNVSFWYRKVNFNKSARGRPKRMLQMWQYLYATASSYSPASTIIITTIKEEEDYRWWCFFFSFSFSFSFSFYFKKILQHPPNTITIDFQHLSFKNSFHKNILIIFYLLSKYAISTQQVHAKGHTSTAQQLRSSGWQRRANI